MKHLLNFQPTVKYRKGSSFMFKVIMLMLYIIPIGIFTFMYYRYSTATSLISEYNEFSEILEKKHDDFQKSLSAKRVSLEDMKEKQEILYDYFRTFSALRFTWNALFETFEKILPANAALKRIQVKPDSALRIKLQGYASDLKQVTDFLRNMYEADSFHDPRLARHSLMKDRSGVSFDLETEYLPELEVMP